MNFTSVSKAVIWTSFFWSVASNSFLSLIASCRVLYSAKALCSFSVHSFRFFCKDLISD